MGSITPELAKKVAEANYDKYGLGSINVDRMSEFHQYSEKPSKDEILRRITVPGYKSKLTEVIVPIKAGKAAANTLKQPVTAKIKFARIVLSGIDLTDENLDTFLDGLPEWCQEMGFGLEIDTPDGVKIMTTTKTFQPDR